MQFINAAALFFSSAMHSN